MAHILLVEDERELNQMVCDYLTNAGHTVRQTYDGSTAVREVFQTPPDLIVLDLNLPGLAGIDLARTVTDQTEIPIIIVSARGEEEDRLAGFSAGVDDYLVKPFSLPELAMRITAVLRRTEQRSASETDASPAIVVGDITIDTERREVTIAGRSAELTAAQFAILATMGRHPGRVFTRLQLLESFQDHAFEGYERTVDVHIGKIRKQIEDDPATPHRLVTVWGVGYRLEDQ
ncbi:MAG: response regulator transcription factor [Spirochaeta sp.]|jgi:DNA-binding response OmpR family regulator|nr:response regulator transcription factor [Spirochaeta sp.]